MDGSDYHPLWLGFFFCLVVIDFVLSAYGAALQAVSENYLEQRSREQDERADNIHHLKDNPGELIHACWFYFFF